MISYDIENLTKQMKNINYINQNKIHNEQISTKINIELGLDAILSMLTRYIE